MKKISPYEASSNGYPYDLERDEMQDLWRINPFIHNLISKDVSYIEAYSEAVRHNDLEYLTDVLQFIIENAHPDDWMMSSPAHTDLAGGLFYERNKKRLSLHKKLLSEAMITII